MANGNNGFREVSGWTPPAGSMAAAEREARLRQEEADRQRQHAEQQRMVREQQRLAREQRDQEKKAREQQKKYERQVAEQRKRFEAQKRTEAQRKQFEKQQEAARREHQKQAQKHRSKPPGKRKPQPARAAKPTGFKKDFLNLATALFVVAALVGAFVLGNQEGWETGQSAMAGGFAALFSRVAAIALYYTIVLALWLAALGGAGWIVVQALN